LFYQKKEFRQIFTFFTPKVALKNKKGYFPEIEHKKAPLKSGAFRGGPDCRPAIHLGLGNLVFGRARSRPDKPF
jgi:hypothetical protein